MFLLILNVNSQRKNQTPNDTIVDTVTGLQAVHSQRSRYGMDESSLYLAPIQSGAETPEMWILAQAQHYCSLSDTYVIVTSRAYISTLL